MFHKTGMMILAIGFASFLQMSSPAKYLPQDWVEGYRYGKVLFDRLTASPEQAQEKPVLPRQVAEAYVEVTVNQIRLVGLCPDEQKRIQQEIERLNASLVDLSREIEIEARVRARVAKRMATKVYVLPELPVVKLPRVRT